MSRRHAFAHLELTWLHALYRALSGVGCNSRDAVFVAVAEEIARRERKVANGRRAARWGERVKNKE